MGKIRGEFKPDFYFCDAVVLVAIDADGLAKFIEALAQTIQNRQHPPRLAYDGATHVFAIEDGKSEVELVGQNIVWHINATLLTEIYEKLDALRTAPSPCHNYVDISSPAKTLVLSRDEYI